MGENAPPSSENKKTATLYMFGTSWCPHCKTAKPIWDDYISNNENLKVGNYDILFKSVDCDAEKNIADKFNVKGYPTFKLERGPGDIVEFEAKPTHDNFTSLLQTSLT
jgi:thiol-disulfide isomerase/thioredoxin